jgi:opacity protein-like surface antigen
MLKGAAIKAGRVYDRCPSTIIDGVLILLAIAAGFAFAVYVVGYRVINPFDTSWLSGDPAHSQLGWAFFRHEPLLSFPLGWSRALGYPLGEPIAWLDCVPIVAMLLWPLKGILPWDFQYLGLLFAFNCVLQLCFGYRISWHLTGHSRLIAIAGALLFLVAPPFVFRSSGHFPLTSHWLILAALTLYFTSSAAPAKWRLAAGAALCFLAATIHAYIMVMVLLIDAGAHLRAAMSSKEIAGTSLGARLYWIGLRVGISLASAIVGLIIFGLLRPLELRAYAESGYGAFSMNLRGGLIGGTLGYNWQLSNVVLGLEGDDAAAWIEGSTVGTLPLPNGNCGGLPPHCDSNLRALGTFRGRVGWAIDRYLPYVTGGLAVGSLHGHEGDTLLNGAVGDGTKTVTAWTLGGGIEAMICPNWSIKAEYLHVDLGKHAVFNDAIPAFPTPVIFAQNVRFTTDVVRVGLNYKFDWAMLTVPH